MKILTGDAFEMLKTLPDESVNCCVTSPPYYGLRDYGIDGQLGLEPSPLLYVERLVNIFRQVKRVLRSDGTLWLNIGDGYAQSEIRHRQGLSGGKVDNPKNLALHQTGRKVNFGVKPKNLLGIPWRVAFSLQDDGWYLRQDIVWSKPNPMPESVKDRCTKAHEYIFLLSKSARYYYDANAIKEPGSLNSHGGGKDHADRYMYRSGRNDKGSLSLGIPAMKKRKKFETSMGGGGTSFKGHSGYFKANGEPISDDLSVRNRRSVWTLTTKPYSEAHFATFPPELPRLCILAGCPEGGIVLDPFSGAGTTLLVASRLGREGIGIELNPEYVEISQRRIYEDAPLFNVN